MLMVENEQCVKHMEWQVDENIALNALYCAVNHTSNTDFRCEGDRAGVMWRQRADAMRDITCSTPTHPS